MVNNNNNIRFFNMIEIALAMAIIAFGMTSILGLFPVGLNACRSSISENCAADTVEQFASYLKGYAESSKANYETLFGNFGGPAGLYTETNSMTDIVIGPATVIAEKSAAKHFLCAITTGKDSAGNPYVPVPVAPGWTIFPYAGPAPVLGPGMYFAVLGPGNYYSTASVRFPSVDFSALIIVWKSPVKSYVPNPTWILDNDTKYGRGAGLNVEISWPLDVADYNSRQKRTFYIEIVKPQQ